MSFLEGTFMSSWQHDRQEREARKQAREKEEVTWIQAMETVAEETCQCPPNISLPCRPCFSREYVMREMYGDDETDRIMDTNDEDLSDHIDLGGGVFVPRSDLAKWFPNADLDAYT